MAIRNDYIAGELRTAAAVNEENTALIALSKAPLNVYMSAANSTTLVNPTAGTPYTLFDTHTYDIPANELINGVKFNFEGLVDFTRGSFTSCGVAVRLGSTVLGIISINPSSDGNFPFAGWIMGTAAAGASVNVRAAMYGVHGGGSGANKCASDYREVAVATNGILTMQFAWYFDTSNAGNTAVLRMAEIWKKTKNGW